MKLEYPYEEGSIYPGPGIDTQYFGKDAEDFLKSIGWEHDIKYLGKECTTENKQGIIVGFEDCQSADDYYYIVYIPSDGTVVYPLANSSEFIRGIIC